MSTNPRLSGWRKANPETILEARIDNPSSEPTYASTVIPFRVNRRVAAMARSAIITLADGDLIVENDAVDIIIELDGDWDELEQVQAVYAAVRRDR